MTTYSVTPQAQALFPDGENQPMSLVNRGPWTIFVDSAPSIGAHSYQLKPTETLVWPEGTPLWVKGNDVDARGMLEGVVKLLNNPFGYGDQYQPSTLIATPITGAAASQDSVTTILPIRNTYMEATNGELAHVSDYPFECGSFKSLIMTVLETPYPNPFGGPELKQIYTLDFYWFDDDYSLVTIDRYNMHGQASVTTEPPEVDPDGIIPQRLVVPVKARYCFVFIDSPEMPRQNNNVRWVIEGSTVELRASVYHWMRQFTRTYDGSGIANYDRAVTYPIFMGNASGGVQDQVDIQHGKDYVYMFKWWTDTPVHLNNVARMLKISARCLSIVSNSFIDVRANDTSGNIYHRMNVSSGSSIVESEIFVPMTQPLYLFSNIPTDDGSTVRLTLSWKD